MTTSLSDCLKVRHPSRRRRPATRTDEGGDIPAPPTAGNAYAGYRGPERRRPMPIPRTGTQVARVAGTVLIILGLWSVVLFMVRSRGIAPLHSLLSVTHSVAGALLLTGAALSFAIWRSTSTTRAAGAVVALTAAGLSTPLTGVLARSSGAGLVDAASAAFLIAAVESSIILCTAATLRAPEIRSDLKPLRYAVPLAAAIVLGAGFVLARGDQASAAFVGRTAELLRLANIGGWLVVAAALAVAGLRKGRRSDVLLGTSLLLIAGGAVATYRLGPVGYQVNLLAVGFDLFVASTVAGAAGVVLWCVHAGHTLRLDTTVSELQATRTDLAVLESAQERRLHDARNAIFAIAGAAELLAHPAQHRSLAPEHLQRLIVAELNRLGHLLDPDFHGETTTFSVRDLLVPLIEAYRVHGITITAGLDDSVLTGRRDLIASAVSNILTNARVHAPGARIWVSTATVYDVARDRFAVRIEIADDGPGIPAEQRDAVLLPGVRGIGATAPGSGLGLASAAQAVAEAHGTLRLAERKGGGTAVTLTVPSARGTAPHGEGDPG